ITSTFSPSTTTISSSTSNISTTTSSLDSTTTTIRNCCEWPFPNQGVNTVDPIIDLWNQCDGPVTFSCTINNETMFLLPTHGIAVNIDINGLYTELDLDTQVAFPEMATTIYGNITCNTTSHLWQLNSNFQYNTFACAYQWTNGTWFWGTSSTSV
ncbi:Protein CBG15994, partial [Caenorhabditis briggsae]